MILASQLNEFLIVAIIAIMIIAVTLLIYYIVTGKKDKSDTKITPNFETKDVVTKTEPVKVEHKEPVKTEPVKPVEVKEEKVEVEKQKALEEEKTGDNIQTLLNQMQQDLDSDKNGFGSAISRYEDDEEANAIISYKELMKYKETNDKDIVLKDKGKEEIKELIKENDKKVDSKEEVKKFRRSEFISPIFGYNEDTNVTYREIKRPPKKETKNSNPEWESDKMLKNLENDVAEVIDFEEKVEEPQKPDENDKFLDELVDFRNKLN